MQREPHLIAFFRLAKPDGDVMGGGENKKQRGVRGNKGGKVRMNEHYRRLQLKGAGEGSVASRSKVITGRKLKN